MSEKYSGIGERSNMENTSIDAIELVKRLGGGHFLDELYTALLRVGEDVVATGKGGTVTVRLKIVKPTQAEPSITVQDEIAVGLPKASTQGAFFFVGEGQFHKKDWRQAEFELRTVEGGKSELRQSDTETALREGN